MYTVSQKKQYTYILTITSANVDRFSKFSHWQIPKETICNYCRAFHLTLAMLLHYLMKLENPNCCRFQCRIERETSEFIWLDMRPFNSSGLNPVTIKLVNNTTVLRRGSVMPSNWNSWWLTCNMGCSRQLLIKLPWKLFVIRQLVNVTFRIVSFFSELLVIVFIFSLFLFLCRAIY